MKKSSKSVRVYLLAGLLVLLTRPNTLRLMGSGSQAFSQALPPTKREVPLVGGPFGIPAEHAKYHIKLFDFPRQRPTVFRLPSLELAPLPAPETYGLPILDNVEDYNNVDDDVKRGVAAISAWLQNKYDIWPVISSGRRSLKNNEIVKGSAISWHLVGRAVDLCVGKLTDDEKKKIKEKAHAMGWEEVMYHDAGDGFHLHLANIE